MSLLAPDPDPICFQDFTVRLWEPRDRDDVLALVKQVLGEYGLDFDPEDADQDLVDVEQHYQNRQGEFWVVEKGGKLIGTGAFYPLVGRPDVAEIRKMYLLPEARGHGLGRALLKLLEERASKNNFSYARLETAAVLKEAIALYEANGYQTASDLVETKRCDRVLMKKL